MAFWSTEKLKKRLISDKLIEPGDERNVKQGAYELGVGPEAFVTSETTKTKTKIDQGQQVIIPPGQFGLLITDEKVTVPTDAIAFISIKAGIKFRGLVNVS